MRERKANANVKYDVVLSIHQEYAELIKTQEKRFEFRKRMFKRPVNNIYLYVTAPVNKIAGWFPFTGCLEGTADEIWKKCQNYAGIGEQDFFRYYSGSRLAYAIMIENYTHYPAPIEPGKLFPEFRAPQSFCYVRRVQ